MQSLATESATTFVTPDQVHLSTAVVKKELKELEEFFIPKHRVQVQDPPLGRGGFGIVRIAELLPAEGWQLGAKTVVVKELMSDNWNIIPLRAAYVSPTANDVLGGPSNVRVSIPKRLAREMKVWAKCHHENILKFIGYHLGDDFEPAYLVSEYMRNGNAKEYLAANPVDGIGRLELVRDTLNGLKYLHTLDDPIVHGDLKALNVLINDNRRGVLCDFGLAEVMRKPAKNLATSGELKASTNWCSLEVLMGADRTVQSDIWSWGCLVLEIMTGLHPYHDAKNSVVVIASLHNRKTPEPSPAPAPALPLRLLELLRECWSFEPKDRPDVIACMSVVSGVTQQEVLEVSFEPTKEEPTGDFTPNANLLSESLAPLSHYFIPAQNPRFLERLAIGIYGTLNRAEMISGNAEAKLVVVRVLKAENWSITPLRRQVREIKVWATCQHPNIAQLLGYYLSDDFQESYIVSEWMKNGNVRDYLAWELPSSTARMQLLKDVSEGLHYLHSRTPPLVHGNLHPANVLANDSGRAVLSDFALAKLLQKARTGHTSLRGNVGHVRWIAPEFFNEEEVKISFSSDIWGWGCLALMIIADEIPYSKIGSDAHIIYAIATGRTPLPAAVPVSLDGLLPTLQDCWNWDPKSRPDSLACNSAVASLV